MDTQRLKEIFAGIGSAKIAVVGDFCLDAYWFADMAKSRLSRETPHFPLPIGRELYSAGAGGNVASNVQALAAHQVYAVSVFGEDWRGDLLAKILADAGVDCRFCVHTSQWITPAYIKPIRMGYESRQEDPRLDFANDSAPDDATEARIKENLVRCVGEVDAIIVADQFDFGVISPGVRHFLAELSREYPQVLLLVDSRSRIGLFENAILKPNAMELCQAMEQQKFTTDIHDLKRLALNLSAQTEQPVFVTMGAKGVLLCREQAEYIPQAPIHGKIDTVGAGDTFIAALACALAAGATLREAGQLGNLASAVAVQKLQQTGTATPIEISQRFAAIRAMI